MPGCLAEETQRRPQASSWNARARDSRLTVRSTAGRLGAIYGGVPGASSDHRDRFTPATSTRSFGSGRDRRHHLLVRSRRRMQPKFRRGRPTLVHPAGPMANGSDRLCGAPAAAAGLARHASDDSRADLLFPGDGSDHQSVLGLEARPLAPARVGEVLASFGERLSRDLLVLVHRVGAGDRGRRRIDRPNE